MTLLSRPACRPAPARRTPPLALLALEDRAVPALLFAFDYSLDKTGFFNNPEARAALERAAADLGGQIQSTPAAITPGGANTWAAIFDDPSNPGAQVRRENMSVPAGTLYVFAGGIPNSSGEAGLGGYGGYSASGGRNWMGTVKSRGMGGFSTWGGSVSFDVSQRWYFGQDEHNRAGGELDFYSVAVHELTHTLGFGTSPQWDSLIQNGVFTGANATAANGGTPPAVSADRGHFVQGTHSHDEPVSMQPSMDAHERVEVSRLDLAALADIGWQVGGTSTPPATTSTPTPNPVATDALPNTVSSPAAPAPAPLVPQATSTLTPVTGGAAVTVVSGATDGTAQAYTSESGALAPVGGTVRPFGGFNGAVRSAVADFNGDGTADLAFGTGPTGGSRIRVFDGKTGADLLPEFSAFERTFAGGVFLAAGDFDRDGRAELLVTPDEGGGPRVRVLALSPAGPNAVADFFGIDDANFRGGARPAVGDISGDGTPDLVIAAGYGGGPRVAVFDGTSVPGGQPKRRLASDFFAFETTLRNGVYVAVGDVDADGRADLTFGAGPGGGPRVVTVSGHTLLGQGGPAAVARPLADQFVGDPTSRGGVRVASKDVDGGGAEVVTGAGTGGEVRVLKANGGTLATMPLLAGKATDGVYVG